MYTSPFVHARCSSFNRGSICGFSPGLWNSDKKPSLKMLVGMAGAVDDPAMGAAGAGLGLVGFGFDDPAAAASAFDRARASSLVPNNEVKYDSSDDLSSTALAHLKSQQESPTDRTSVLQVRCA